MVSALTMTGDDKGPALIIMLNEISKCLLYIFVSETQYIVTQVRLTKIRNDSRFSISRCINIATAIISAGLIRHHP